MSSERQTKQNKKTHTETALWKNRRPGTAPQQTFTNTLRLPPATTEKERIMSVIIHARSMKTNIDFQKQHRVLFVILLP